MGDSTDTTRYWCHVCSQVVSPIMEVELKCPFCESGFVEEMGGDSGGDLDAALGDLGSDRARSLWAPILLGMMGNSRRRRFRREEEDDELDQEQGHDVEATLRRRRRSSALLQLLLGLRAGLDTDADGEREGEREGDRDRDRERDPSLMLINPFNQAAIIIRGSSDRNDSYNPSADAPAGVSLGDYFAEPGLDLLLQHLSENDPNRYGTPPAKKEAVDALPTVKVKENLSCSVCLEDFACGDEAKEMPCRHRFHSGCILPWLDLHSSCPVCRFQIPADESKDTNGSSSSNRVDSNGSVGTDDVGNGGNGRRFWIPVPWPFSGMFSLSGSQGSGNTSSSAPGNSREDEN